MTERLRSMAKSIPKSGYHREIADGEFFDELESRFSSLQATESSIDERDDFSRDVCRWLRLIRTDAIETWARQSTAVKNALRTSNSPMGVALRALLQRHVLHLGTRRDISRLQSFWHWATREQEKFSSIWRQEEFEETLNTHRQRHEQEAAFLELLERCLSRIKDASGPTWAIDAIKQILAQRQPSNRSVARVVFALQQDEPDEFLRNGWIVDFTLLAKPITARAINDPQVFDERFLASVEGELRRRIDSQQFRWLEHDWGFLSSDSGPVLGDCSGTMAIWSAMWLAGGGSNLQGQQWALPPWVMVTAQLNKYGSGAGGVSDAVGHIQPKIEVMIDEGVRVLFVADAMLSEEMTAHDYLQMVHGAAATLPGSRDLWLIPFVGEDNSVLRDRLMRNDCLWPVTLDPLENRPLFGPTPDPNTRHHVSERHKAQFLQFDIEDDFIPPTYAIEKIKCAIQSLPGRGYIHVTGSAGIGKSVLVKAIKEGWANVSQNITLSYAVLHGRPESPRDFLQRIVHQARNGDGTREPLYDLPDPANPSAACLTLEQIQDDLWRVLSQAKKYWCGNGRLILAIDGINELNFRENGLPNVLDTLPSATRLPDGCFILLTSRSVALANSVSESLSQCADSESCFVKVALSRSDPGYLSMLTQYVVDGSRLTANAEPFLQGIFDRAEFRFLYVRFIAELLRSVELSEGAISELPSGEEIIDAYLERLAVRVIGGQACFAEWHVPVLALVSAAFQPISRNDLRTWLAIHVWDAESNHRLDCTLDELRALLRVEALEQRDVFSLGHSFLADWFLGNNSGEWKQQISNAHDRISRTSLATQWNAQALRTIDDYSFRHLPAHLCECNLHDAATEWLTSSEISACHEMQWTAHVQNLRWNDFSEFADDRIGQVSRLLNPKLRIQKNTQHSLMQLKGRLLAQRALAAGAGKRRDELQGKLAEESREMLFQIPGNTPALAIDRSFALRLMAKVNEAPEYLDQARNVLESFIYNEDSSQCRSALLHEYSELYENFAESSHRRNMLQSPGRCDDAWPEISSSFETALTARYKLIDELGGSQKVAKSREWHYLSELGRQLVSYHCIASYWGRTAESNASLARKGLAVYEDVVEAFGGAESCVLQNPQLIEEWGRQAYEVAYASFGRTGMGNIPEFAIAADRFRLVIESIGGVESALSLCRSTVSSLIQCHYWYGKSEAYLGDEPKHQIENGVKQLSIALRLCRQVISVLGLDEVLRTWPNVLQDFFFILQAATFAGAFARRRDFSHAADMERSQLIQSIYQHRDASWLNPARLSQTPVIESILKGETTSDIEPKFSDDSILESRASDQQVFETSPTRQLEHDSVRKIGRNEPCPCGSGRKYKRCCINKPR